MSPAPPAQGENLPGGRPTLCRGGVAGLLLLGALLLLAHLGDGRLWQDEAETAVLGRNILRYGYPRAFDGVNWVNPALPLARGYAWTYHSWLPMYLTAGSFSLLGVSTFSARLPFALLGWASLWLACRLFRRMTGDPWATRLAAGMLVLSVPFLLHMRQCRYYALAAFFTLWAVWAYGRFLGRRRWGAVELTAALTLLFHSDHGAFLPVVSALVLHYAWNRPDEKGLSRRHCRMGMAVGAVTLLMTAPWMIYLQAWQHHGGFSLKEVSHHLQFYFRQVNRFVIPIFFWLILVSLKPRWFRGLFGAPGTPQRREWTLAGTLLAVGFLFLIFLPEQRHFRYLILWVPWLVLLQAALLTRLFRAGRPALAWGLTLVLVFTDLIHYSGTSLVAAQIPAVRAKLSSPDVKCRSLPLEFLGELTHPYRGPVDGIVEILQTQGRDGESVKIPYEEIPLIFYLPKMKVEPIAKTEDFTRETFPDWIILRRDWLPGGFLQSRYFQQIQARYRQITLDAPDIPWQNRPDPGYHRFQTDSYAPPVIVFQRIR